MEVIFSVEHGQGLRNVEVEELERRECPDSVKQPVDQSGHGQYRRSAYCDFARKDSLCFPRATVQCYASQSHPDQDVCRTKDTGERRETETLT